MNLLTCQHVAKQPKRLQFRQFDDFGWNWPYTKTKQNSEKREMVNWFTMVLLFDVEIRLQDHWVKLWIYWPVSWLTPKARVFKFVNLTISGGIGPIQSQDKTAKKGRWWTVLFDVKTRLQDHWVKLWIYWPVSWLHCRSSSFKFVNLTISGGIGPIQSQDKTAKKGGWWTGSPGLIWRKDMPSRSLGKIVNLSTCQLVSL